MLNTPTTKDILDKDELDLLGFPSGSSQTKRTERKNYFFKTNKSCFLDAKRARLDKTKKNNQLIPSITKSKNTNHIPKKFKR